MLAKQILRQIRELTSLVVGLGLSNEQNFPTEIGSLKGSFEITVRDASAIAVALKNIPYDAVYYELEKAKCFNFKLLDGALVGFQYRFNKNQIVEHRLTYFPSPDLEHFQNEPRLYIEDELYADIIARNIVPFPFRFDFNQDAKRFDAIYHPYSHLSLGQYKNCRIPVCSPLSPSVFLGFILRNFYNTPEQKYSDKIPSEQPLFKRTITTEERGIPHISFPTL